VALTLTVFSIRFISFLWYSEFVNVTGWELFGTYEPMPQYLHTFMSDFFAPYNAVLFNMLGRTFTNEDW
jgi:hypothetical protein